MMDIAMARTVQAIEEPGLHATIDEYFQDALNTGPSPEMLSVSRRGWQFLLDACPPEPDWDGVRHDLQHAIGRIDALVGGESA